MKQIEEGRVYLPCLLDTRQVLSIFRQWLRDMPVAPAALRDLKQVQAQQMYIPYSLYRVRIDLKWTARVGKAGHQVDGNYDSSIWEWTKWERVCGHFQSVDVHDLCVPAVSHSARQELKYLDDFNRARPTSQPDELDARYLRTPIDEAQLGEEARELVVFRGFYDLDALKRKALEQAQRQVLGGDRHPGGVRGLEVQVTHVDEHFQPVWAPVYMMRYRSNDQQHTVFVNGQTGKLRGERPVAMSRVMFYAVAFMFPAVFLFLVEEYFPDFVVMESGFSLVRAAFFVALFLGVSINLTMLVYYTFGQREGRMYQTYDPIRRTTSI